MSEGNALVQAGSLVAKLVGMSLEESVVERCFQYCQNGGCHVPISLIKVVKVIASGLRSYDRALLLEVYTTLSCGSLSSIRIVSTSYHPQILQY